MRIRKQTERQQLLMESSLAYPRGKLEKSRNSKGKNLKGDQTLGYLGVVNPVTPAEDVPLRGCAILYADTIIFCLLGFCYITSTIDLTVIKNFLFPYEIHSLSELSSDHNPVLLCFYFKYSLPDCQGKTTTNWKKIKNTLTNSFNVNILNINTPDKIDDLATEIENQINHAKIMSSSPSKPNQILFNAELVKFNKERNIARKMVQNSRNPALKRKMNNLNKQIIKLSEKIESERLNNKLININIYDGKLWNFVRPFKCKKQNIPTLNGTVNTAFTDIEKANCRANSLETQFTLNNI
ncbi:hypothetical protein AVEN_56154-1 [Araneus ventricosus]|uniref:Endonuclease/exonuclease/phosphatase domain-containing protein n=1 Tax=Araneus ventricosus TaxID=182803 RepID=A0A4Y2MJG5_ARAVE|nr:hypothetical protein AVEN_56154-1 [Araneus ventricosus]